MDRIEDFPELVDLLVIETVGGNTPVLIEFLIIEIFDLFIYFFHRWHEPHNNQQGELRREALLFSFLILKSM